MQPFCRILILAFAVFAVPAVASPGTVTTPTVPPADRRVTYTYKTFLDPGAVDYWTIRNFNVDFGTAKLTFNPDKTVEGTYRPDSSKPSPVSGRLMRGGRLWLQIGRRRFTGRFTPRGFALISGLTPPGWRLWGQLVPTPGSAASADSFSITN